jgi:hypothetical protein
LKNGGAVRVIVSGKANEAKLAFEFMSAVVKPKPEKSVLEAKTAKIRAVKSTSKKSTITEKRSNVMKSKTNKKSAVRTVPKIRLD